MCSHAATLAPGRRPLGKADESLTNSQPDRPGRTLRVQQRTADVAGPRAEGDNGIVTTRWFTELMAGHHLLLLRQHPDFQCDFETARRIVYSDARKTWDGFGTLYVAPYGSEDATHWQVIVGAREDIVDHDWMFMALGAPLVLVDKSTGEISRHVVIENFARLDGMSRVGPWPDEMDFS